MTTSVDGLRFLDSGLRRARRPAVPSDRAVAAGKVPVTPTDFARRLARNFDVHRPACALARWGLELRIFTHLLALPGRRVHGIWDPLLQRIELYEGSATCPDVELVAVLGHELWHALAGRLGHSLAADDRVAECFATAWLTALGPQRIATCAAALRALAHRLPPVQPAVDEVLSIGS